MDEVNAYRLGKVNKFIPLIVSILCVTLIVECTH